MKKKINVIGIDPGLDGAVAKISSDMYATIIDTPTYVVEGATKKKREYNINEMISMIRELAAQECHVFLEKVHSMPGQGVASMFSMGYGYGLWNAILASLYIPYTLVLPQRWKKELLLGVGQGKNVSVYRAQQLFPESKLFGPKGGPLDGRGDALLIAEYGRRIINGDS